MHFAACDQLHCNRNSAIKEHSANCVQPGRQTAPGFFAWPVPPTGTVQPRVNKSIVDLMLLTMTALFALLLVAPEPLERARACFRRMGRRDAPTSTIAPSSFAGSGDRDVRSVIPVPALFRRLPRPVLTAVPPPCFCGRSSGFAGFVAGLRCLRAAVYRDLQACLRGVHPKAETRKLGTC